MQRAATTSRTGLLEAKWKVKWKPPSASWRRAHPAAGRDGGMMVVTDAIGVSEGYHLLKNFDDLIILGINDGSNHSCS